MKYLKLSMLVPALFFSNTFAQATNLNTVKTDPESGIYLTAADYKEKQLHLAGDQSTNNKLRVNDFFGGKTLTLNHNGQRHEFSKDSIYGYRAQDGNDYRFYKSYSSPYKILESGSLVIYEIKQPGNKQNGFKPIIRYYFSDGADGEVNLLSLANLKNTFKDQPAFDIIANNFQTDHDLITYDDYHHMFRINRLLAKL
ncbi:hypothetical protein [Pedobacter cryoconitis]|uniref:Uncharacterized protein n=1 Tax=Pedobacter cryoconitis TaxID=188932 RepID=A0A327SVR7_9SPHI|nr:hypothetical protein [Pedobacter cryoconitis]RAJ33018.1 hypothetical protein LY11_01708 [Pedobacter cryoconitis]